MRKILLGLAGLLVVICAVGFAVYKNDVWLLDTVAAATPDTSLAEHKAFIAPYVVLRGSPSTISDDQPAPTVVMFHGCAGYRSAFMETWTATFSEAGWRVFSVDSHTPRDISRDVALETVCTGRKLLGQERTGDIVASLQIIAARPDVDPTRLVVAGWSHGAWTIMDTLAMDYTKRTPAAISDKNVSVPELAGAILFYPYCGKGSWAGVNDWTISPPTAAFIGGSDTVVDGPLCKEVLEDLATKGNDISISYYPDAEHIFDDVGSPDYYSAEANADAREGVRDFLSALL
ncbi:MAG: dienelactone hydrolase family protein [Pseudomonadota bacterium]